MKLEKKKKKSLFGKTKLIHNTSMLYLPFILKEGLLAKSMARGNGLGDSWKYYGEAKEKGIIQTIEDDQEFCFLFGEIGIMINPENVDEDGGHIKTQIVKPSLFDAIAYNEDHYPIVNSKSQLNKRFLLDFLFNEVKVDNKIYLKPSGEDFSGTYIRASDFFNLVYHKTNNTNHKKISEEIDSLSEYKDQGALLDKGKLSFTGKELKIVKKGSIKKGTFPLGEIVREGLRKEEFDFSKWEKGFSDALIELGYNPNYTVMEFFNHMNNQSDVPFYLRNNNGFYRLEKNR